MADLMGMLATMFMDLFSLMYKSISIADIVSVDIKNIIQRNSNEERQYIIDFIYSWAAYFDLSVTIMSATVLMDAKSSFN